jgi:hypothetical protein
VEFFNHGILSAARRTNDSVELKLTLQAVSLDRVRHTITKTIAVKIVAQASSRKRCRQKSVNVR